MPVDLQRLLAGVLGERVYELGDDVVPVITRYYGKVPGGLLEAIGRGYTDLCAALVAVGLRARELQIWKEVDGIFTADPRKVPTAKLLESVTPSEAAELTFYGSEVIHPRTEGSVVVAPAKLRVATPCPFNLPPITSNSGKDRAMARWCLPTGWP